MIRNVLAAASLAAALAACTGNTITDPLPASAGPSFTEGSGTTTPPLPTPVDTTDRRGVIGSGT